MVKTRQKKILLLNLPNYCPDRKFFSPPLGLSYLAASLNSAGHFVKGLDLAATEEKNRECYLSAPKKYLNEIVAFNPDYVLIGCLVHNRFNVFYWSKLIKRHLKKTKIILGNHFASCKPVEILQNTPSIDYVVLGEAEETIVRLISALEKKSLNGLGNVYYRSGGKIVIFKKNSQPLNLDKLPFPKRDIFNDSDYSFSFGEKTFSKVAPISASRGCSMPCTFCSCRVFEGSSYRRRSTASILEEIYKLNDEGYSTFMFVDDTFTMNEERLKEFCAHVIRDKRDIRWICWSCLNIRPSLLNLMKKAGCIFISFGLESANQDILKHFKKNINLDLAKKVIAKCLEIGIDIRLTLLMNSGFESISSLRQTNDFLKQLGVRKDMLNYSNGVWIFPDTELEKELYGLTKSTFDWFKPENKGFFVEKDDNGNHIVPLFKGEIVK